MDDLGVPLFSLETTISGYYLNPDNMYQYVLFQYSSTLHFNDGWYFSKHSYFEFDLEMLRIASPVMVKRSTTYTLW